MLRNLITRWHFPLRVAGLLLLAMTVGLVTSVRMVSQFHSHEAAAIELITARADSMDKVLVRNQETLRKTQELLVANQDSMKANQRLLLRGLRE